MGGEPGAAAAEPQAGGEDHQGAEAAHQREESHPLRVLHRLSGNSEPRPDGSGHASCSVPDPDLNPDPHVFGPSGSGSISKRYGSGSFYHPSIIKQK